MKKSIKKVLSLALVLVMLCSMMSISAFATSTDPEITVYFTRGNFSSGGYNFNTNQFIASTYQGTTPPADSTRFATDLFSVTVKLSDVNTTVTKPYYDTEGEYSGGKNALDVIITALLANNRTPYGGWDSYNDGGALYGFNNDGSTDYFGYTTEVHNNHTYRHYTGTNWQIAYNQTVGGALAASSTYGTGITNLFDGMIIVFDLSNYDMYYQVS